MTENSVKARLILRNGLASEWLEKNPILMRGEIGAEIDTGLLKLGDGINHFNDLSYINISFEQLNTKLDLTGGTMTGALILNYMPSNSTDAVNKGYVDNAISNANLLKRSIVNFLPPAQEAEENTIYMIKDALSLGPDFYKEYMLINGQMQQIGDTSVDLTNYFEKPNNFVAGNIISINAQGEIYDTGVSASNIQASVNVVDLEQNEDDELILYCGIAQEMS